MFRSLRWRLVASYMLLTLLTAVLMGGLAYTLVRKYIDRRELDALSSNAEAVAGQALPLLSPVVRHPDLEVLVETSSYLGDVRVRILDQNQKVIVDSGSPRRTSQFIWVQPSEFESQAAIQSGWTNTLIVPMVQGEMRIVSAEEIALLEELPSEFSYQIVGRVEDPWGSRVVFEEPQEIEVTVDEAMPRSGRVYTVPIGEPNDPAGFVELRESASSAGEALHTTTNAFLFAAGGSVILSLVVGLLIARRLTNPIMQLTAAAGQMSAGDLSARSPEFGEDEIGQLARQFNQMAGALEDNFQALEEERDALRRFISDASHELRTPVTALNNFLELLQGKARKDSKASAEFLAESQTQVERLAWIIDNLLNLSRLDAGIIPLELAAVDAGQLLEAAAVPFEVEAKERGIILEVAQPDPGFAVQVDAGLMELALSNLIDNALKFMPEAGGHVKVGGRRVEGMARLWVRDNGIGIPAEDLPHIFERFYRGKGVAAKGSGLGLAMVKSVVEAHGGCVLVESEPGAGSQFVIELLLEDDM